MEKSLVIGAGGTGGHMFPAAAFATEMQARGWRVGLVSDVRGMRYAAEFPAHWSVEIKASSPNLRKPWTLPKTAWQIQQGIGTCKRVLRKEGASVAIGFGGYPAFPLLAAARRMGVNLAVHEQNAVLGRVNRQFAAHARFVASGFDHLERLPDAAKSRHIVTGNPVRAPIRAARDVPFPDMDGDINLLITGGSQGTQLFGDVIPAALIAHLPEGLRARLHVVHQVRAEQADAVKTRYEAANITATIQAFFSDMPERLAAAHVIIARSGAGTISEIAMVGRPSILIPLRIAMDNHQVSNARALTDVGGAEMIEESALSAQGLGEILTAWLTAPETLAQKAQAAHDAAKLNAEIRLADKVEALFDTAKM